LRYFYWLIGWHFLYSAPRPFVHPTTFHVYLASVHQNLPKVPMSHFSYLSFKTPRHYFLWGN
jgi:hypothetical protein